MRRRSRAGSVKPRRRKPAAPKRPSGTETARPRLAAASQESEAARLASELSAVSEILRLISNSPSDVGTVLQSVAERAAHICQARAVDIFLVEDNDLRDVAWFGELKRTTLAFPLDRSTVAGRSVCEMRPVSIDDLQNAGDDFARGREIARRDGHRSILAVPLIRGGRAVGTILIRRTEIRPFEQKHIVLLTTFADQAVIAIENARLFEAEQQRTHELTESLEQQTATSEVLKVISSSPGDLQPVFEAMLANATRLCKAKFGVLYRSEGDAFPPLRCMGHRWPMWKSGGAIRSSVRTPQRPSDAR
jgi:two-component system NtrC family sensor kinase